MNMLDNKKKLCIILVQTNFKLPQGWCKRPIQYHALLCLVEVAGMGNQLRMG
jgi:hypothetical protein